MVVWPRCPRPPKKHLAQKTLDPLVQGPCLEVRDERTESYGMHGAKGDFYLQAGRISRPGSGAMKPGAANERCKRTSNLCLSSYGCTYASRAVMKHHQRTNALACKTNKQIILSPEIAVELPSGPKFGCNRNCKTNPVDLAGSGGQVLVV